MSAPPPDVVAAFGRRGEPQPLAGGEGHSWLVDDIVLKPAYDDREASWIADLLARLSTDGFRIARPIATRQGGWVAAGWAAYEWVEGRETLRGRLRERFAAAAAFHRALAGVGWPDFMAARSNPWITADRMVWGERPLRAAPRRRTIVDRLAVLATGPAGPAQIVHGDLAGNLLFTDDLPPAVIDFAPYHRPIGYADGIVAADLLIWGADAGPEVLRYADPPDIARGLLFRALSDLHWDPERWLAAVEIVAAAS